MNHHKIKIATWEDSSTPLGLTCRGVIPFNQTGCIWYGASPSPGLDGDESSPLHCVYRVWGFTIHRHRLYLPRGGRQVAAPTYFNGCREMNNVGYSNNCQLSIFPYAQRRRPFFRGRRRFVRWCGPCGGRAFLRTFCCPLPGGRRSGPGSGAARRCRWRS